jgi:hypothetical protein
LVSEEKSAARRPEGDLPLLRLNLHEQTTVGLAFDARIYATSARPLVEGGAFGSVT